MPNQSNLPAEQPTTQATVLSRQQAAQAEAGQRKSPERREEDSVLPPESLLAGSWK